jgi:hypothetical protein
VAQELFQQNLQWWRQVVVTTEKIFVVTDYCDNTNILWQKDSFNKKTEIGGTK